MKRTPLHALLCCCKPAQARTVQPKAETGLSGQGAMSELCSSRSGEDLETRETTWEADLTARALNSTDRLRFFY